MSDPSQFLTVPTTSEAQPPVKEPILYISGVVAMGIKIMSLGWWRWLSDVLGLQLQDDWLWTLELPRVESSYGHPNFRTTDSGCEEDHAMIKWEESGHRLLTPFDLLHVLKQILTFLWPVPTSLCRSLVCCYSFRVLYPTTTLGPLTVSLVLHQHAHLPITGCVEGLVDTWWNCDNTPNVWVTFFSFIVNHLALRHTYFWREQRNFF